MSDAEARGLPKGAPGRIWRPDIRDGMWFFPYSGRMVSEAEFSVKLTYGTFVTSDITGYTTLCVDYPVFLTAIDWMIYVEGLVTWVFTLQSMGYDNVYTTIKDYAGADLTRSSAGLAANTFWCYTDRIYTHLDTTLGNSGSNSRGLAYLADEQTGASACYTNATVRYRLVAP
jgi:hypothetical protein